MSTHRYQIQSLYGDYVRAGLGILIPVVVMAAANPDWPVRIAFIILAVICAYFLLKTIDRHRTVVGIDDEGITVAAFSKTGFRWTELSRFELNYYSLRRDRQNGWMELVLRSGRRTIKLDSSLEEFVPIVRRAYQAAKANHLAINPISQANLNALRIY